MRKIRVMVSFLGVAFLALNAGSTFAQTAKSQGQPFMNLQQQIDELKAQINGIQSSNVGNIAVYDANDNFLGILTSSGWGDQLSFYIPSLNAFARIVGLRKGENVNIESFWVVYFTADGTPYVDNESWVQRLEGCGVTEDRYLIGTGNRTTIMAVSTQQACDYFYQITPPRQFIVSETLEVFEEDIPFPLPIATPIKIQYVRQFMPTD